MTKNNFIKVSLFFLKDSCGDYSIINKIFLTKKMADDYERMMGSTCERCDVQIDEDYDDEINKLLSKSDHFYNVHLSKFAPIGKSDSEVFSGVYFISTPDDNPFKIGNEDFEDYEDEKHPNYPKEMQLDKVILRMNFDKREFEKTGKVHMQCNFFLEAKDSVVAIEKAKERMRYIEEHIDEFEGLDRFFDMDAHLKEKESYIGNSYRLEYNFATKERC